MLPSKAMQCCPSLTLLRRTFYTAEFLGMDRFLLHQRQELASKKDTGAERTNVLATAAKWPIMVVKDDIKFMIYSSSDVGQVAETGEVLRAYVESKYGQRHPKVTQGLSALYFQICHCLGAVEEAIRLFDDGALINKIHVVDCAKDMTSVLTPYFDLLFEKELYEEIIYQYDKISAVSAEAPMNLLKLAVASCAKLNTSESYALSGRFLRDAEAKGSNVLGLPSLMHALLACRHGHAVEALADVERTKVSSVRNNLIIHILVQLGRTDQALDYLEQCLCAKERIPTEMRAKLLFSKEVVDGLKVAAEGDDATKSRLDKILTDSRSDYVTLDSSLENLVIKPFDSKNRLDKAKRRDAELLRTNKVGR